MKKKFVVPGILITFLLTLACGVGMDGIDFGNGPEATNDPFREVMVQQTFDAMFSEEPGSDPAEATPEPEYQPVIPPGSEAERVVTGLHEYSVNATNFECTCQATGNLAVDFKFTGDQVEITNGGGGATFVYDKIGDNKYQRIFMGYYILMNGEGAQATETKVEEEKRVLITLTDNGYVMENFSGSSSSPCCYYTFTVEQ